MVQVPFLKMLKTLSLWSHVISGLSFVGSATAGFKMLGRF
jgi:hypothetical protein